MQVTTETTITLKLSIEEALYLKSLLQNPMDNESEDDIEIKKSMFSALPSYEWLYSL